MYKYEMVGVRVNGLQRIRALKDFGDVKTGDVGGWIESETNLSHEGLCWIFDNAKAFGDARVFDNASLRDNAQAYMQVKVYGNAKAFNNVKISYNAEVFGNAEVYDNVQIFGHAKLYGDARAVDNAQISYHAEVTTTVSGNAKIAGHEKL